MRGIENPNDVDETQPPQPEPIPSSTYFFGEPGEFAQDLQRVGVSPRRFFFQVAIVAPTVALLGNLFGCTSALLGFLPPDVVASSNLDTYFPVRTPSDGTMIKRFVATDGAYDFKLPASWLEDQAVVLAKARRFEGQQAFSGDGTQWPVPPRQPAQRKGGNIPDAAFGPAEQSRGDGTENVSVVRSKLGPGFTLKGTLGEPAEAAAALLSNVIAAPGSGRTAELVRAGQEVRGTRRMDEGGLVYTLEYVLTRKDGKKVHNLAVVAAVDSELLTLTAVCPEAEFSGKETSLRRLAESFRLL